jgi:hypothetical protein
VKRVLVASAALVGVLLTAAAGAVLADGTAGSLTPENDQGRPIVAREVADVVADATLRVIDPLLVVNKDGSAALGASVENGQDVDVSLMGVTVWVDRNRVAVNETQWWLPIPAGERAQVGAASDAGGFVVPSGINVAPRADVEFWFDDGTCVLADVPVVARTTEHRSIFPRSGKPIGPVTTDRPPAGTGSCTSD